MPQFTDERARNIARHTQREAQLLKDVPNATGDDRVRILNALAEVGEAKATDEARLVHRYFCDFCKKWFESVRRGLLGVMFFYDHDEEGTATKHRFRNEVLVMCPDCKVAIDPVTALHTEAHEEKA